MKKISVDNLTWNAVGFLKDGLIVNDTKHNYSQGVFLSDYVTILSKKFIVNRENYVDRYQNEIREICSVVFGCTDEQSGRLTDSIVSQVKSEWYKFVGAYIWNTGINPWGTEEKALKIVSGWLRKALQDAGITDYNELVIDYAGVKLSDLMLALVSNHPNYFTTDRYITAHRAIIPRSEFLRHRNTETSTTSIAETKNKENYRSTCSNRGQCINTQEFSYDCRVDQRVCLL